MPADPSPLFHEAPQGTAPEPWAITQAHAVWRPLQETLPVYGDTPGAPSFGPKVAAQSGQSPEAARAAGYAEGMHKAQQEIAAQTQRLHQSIAEVEGLWERQVRNCEADLARLALVVAEEIIKAELPARQNFTVVMAQHALQLLSGAPTLTLRVHPADAAHLRANASELCARPGLRLIEDNTLHAGGVVAECAEGRVDASVAERLRAMCRALVQHAGPSGAP